MLQEAEDKEPGEENVDADVTVDAGKVNEDCDNIIILMEEDQKTLEYQEYMKVDVKNITKNPKNIWEPIYEVIDTSFVEEKNIFLPAFLGLCKKFKSTSVFTIWGQRTLENNGYGTSIICTSSHDTLKRLW